MTQLRDRVAVITGATAGIGEAIARQFVQHEAFCVLNGRREGKLKELARELGDEDAAVVAGDCADDGVISRMLAAGRGRGGDAKRGADLIVVNAGRGLAGSVLTSDTSQWEEMVRTNLIGAAKLIRAAAQAMIADMQAELGPKAETPGVHVLNRPRDIIVIGSTVGRHISPFSSMYGSTKFGVHAITEGARRELGPKGIRVSLVEPGFVVSEFQGVAGYDPKWFEERQAALGPVLKPEDVARTVVFIASQPAAVHVGDVLIRPTRQEYP